MGNRCHISSSQKDLVVCMSLSLTPHQISQVTGISFPTVHHILQLWVQTGNTTVTLLQNGCPWELSNLDLLVRAAKTFLYQIWLLTSKFLEGLISWTPDMYLSKMQDHLYSACRIQVCEATITNSLKQRGWAWKKVCLCLCLRRHLIMFLGF